MKSFFLKLALFLVAVPYWSCNSKEDIDAKEFEVREKTVTRKIDDNSNLIGEPLFKISAEHVTIPLFSIHGYSNGNISLKFLKHVNPPIRELLTAKTREQIAKLRLKPITKVARLDSAEFLEMKRLIVEGLSNLSNNGDSSAYEETMFTLHFLSENNQKTTIKIFSPLSNSESEWLKRFYEMALKKFPGDTSRILFEGLKRYTPSLHN